MLSFTFFDSAEWTTAERTIDVIKDALIDGDYIHHIDLRRNNK